MRIKSGALTLGETAGLTGEAWIRVTAAGILTTAIRLTAARSITITAASVLTTGAGPLSAAATIRITGAGLLTTAIRFAAAPTIRVTTAGTLLPTLPLGYLQARSGIARSDVTYAGFVPPMWTITIGGVLQTTNVEREGFVITERLDNTPATCEFTVNGIAPQLGQDVKVTLATPNEYLFGGTLLQRKALPYHTRAGAVRWQCVAVGYPWLMDRFDKVVREYTSTGVGTMVADILARYTDGGFRVGYIPQELGNLDMTFTYETVSACMQRIASAKGAFWDCTPERIVNMYQTYPEAPLPTLTGDNIVLPSSDYTEDLSQMRTRVTFRGYGSVALAAATAGDTTIAVEDLAFYNPAGGTVMSGANVVSYTATTATSGPGSLTGCGPITYEITIGDPIDVLVREMDNMAETALAAALGDGLSGQARHYAADGRLTEATARSRAETELSVFSTALKDLTFDYVHPPRHLQIGRPLTIFITSPYTISGTFLIRSLQTRVRGNVSGATIDLWRQVTATRFMRHMADLLRVLG